MTSELNNCFKPQPAQKRCGECGRLTATFHSIYKGDGFCCACYTRVFIRKECQACGQGYRIHPKQDFAYCRACRPKMIPCFRCHRTNYPIGCYFKDKPVCNTCAPHFKTEKACPRCGKLSAHLAKALEFGVTEAICKSCISAYYNPCELCGRARHPLKEKDGHHLCSKCYRLGLIPCPDCANDYPAGVGLRCRDCYLRKLTRSKAQIAIHLYEQKSTQHDIIAFAEWLLSHTTLLKASVSVNRFHSFFKVVDESPDDWFLSPHLLAPLDKELLRKDGYARLFYESLGKIIPAEVLADVSTWRSIYKHLEYIYQPSPYPLSKEAQHYAKHCRTRIERNEIKLRTLKQQLSAVVSFTTYLKRCNRQLSEDSVSEFLRHYPGLEASLTGFLVFFNGPRAPITAKRKRFKTSSKSILKAYLRQPIQEEKRPPIKVIHAALNYLHGVPKSLLPQVTMKHVYGDAKTGWEVRIQGFSYILALKPNHVD
ncbi:hypothetical protein [Aliidiomarina taiwanensis]|uniref:hypothetical protein n=1 Tax=Aliidiomarina taiwanensis TaxID=946228 RepID=UPI000F861A2C|nr:hypothetical protein [Aliidiomarina taiwanensis]